MVISRNSRICSAILLTIIICLFNSLVQAKYNGGTGEHEDPYRIASTDDLIRLSVEIDDWDKHFVLISDINLEGYVFTDALIGTSKMIDDWYEGTPFTGIFEGNSFTIRNLFIDPNNIEPNNSVRDCVGLFGIIGLEGVVNDLNLEGTYIIASNYVGALSGINEGTIENCINDGIIYGDKKIGGLVGSNKGNIINSYTAGQVCVSNNDIDSNDVGGLAGVNYSGGFIHECQSTCEINGLQRKCENFGGLVGYNKGMVLNCRSAGPVQGENNGNINFGGLIGKNEGKIIICYSEGSVKGNSQNVGGLIGYNSGRASNSYSSGGLSIEVELEGNKYVGGLIGHNQGQVINCYSTGRILRGSSRGGLVGYNNRGSVINSVWDVDTSGIETSAGGDGLTTQQMGEINNYNVRDWDTAGNKEDGLHEIWQIPQEGGYPVLSIFNEYEPAHLFGQGTVEDPYLISDANELGSILYYDPKANYLLTDNIDLSGINWSDSIIPIFAGVFDGNDFVISNIRMISKANHIGLFGSIDSQSELKNLDVNDVTVLGSMYVGGLAGLNKGLIENCSSIGRIGGGSYVGGLIGHNSGSILDCNSITVVNGELYYVGGLIGMNNGSITRCYSNCYEVIGKSYVGGLVGDNYDGNVSQCYSDCNEVRGESYIGGLIGDNDDGTINDCYHDGLVNGDRKVGGIVGNNYDGYLKNSYNVGQVFGTEDVGEIAGDNKYVDDNWIPSKVYHGTIIDCFSNEERISEYLKAGWDFTHIWEEPRVGYPKLRCQKYKEPIYQINNVNDLIDLTLNPEGWNKYYVLTADIDLSGIELEPIGDFNGIFEGNEHTISNLDINLPYQMRVGLFGEIGKKGFVRNLVMKDVHVHGNKYVGGIVGSNKGSIDNIKLSGSVLGTNDRIGGLAGRNDGSLKNCHINGEVDGRNYIGGLVGLNSNDIYGCSSAVEVSGNRYVGGLVGDSYGKVIRSMSACNVNGNDDYIGGLIGRNLNDPNHSSGQVHNCYSEGNVKGDRKVGGLIGSNSYEVKCCYARGKVEGNTNVGGLIGSSSTAASTSRSFWDIQTSGQTISEGGTGKTTSEMKMVETFLSSSWNIVSGSANVNQHMWWIDAGQGYPHLTWELIYKPLPCPNEGNGCEPNEPFEPNEVIQLTDENFNCIVINSNLPVLVHFWALYSMDYLWQAPVIEEIAEEFAGKLKVCELLTNDYSIVSETYNITETPTIILFKDGQIQKKWIGVTNKEDIIPELDFSES